MSYVIKSSPEDFIVKEMSSFKTKEEGEFVVFLMKKKNYTTENAIQQLARVLHIDRKSIGYAGSKDSKAITEQFISIKGVSKEKVLSLSFKDINLSFIGFSDQPISLGDLDGNSFEIVVRNLSEGEKPKAINCFINVFGEQRFSINNADIGKAIIKKDFKRAVELLIESNTPETENIKQHLENHVNDYVGALKRIPWKTLNLYVHAFQSKMWNETAKKYAEKMQNEVMPAASASLKIPIIGFATETEGIINDITKQILKEEDIKKEDFIIRAIPDLSSAGTERELFVEVKDLKIAELEDDELNPDKKKVKVSFSLGKGSYATEAIKEMFL